MMNIQGPTQIDFMYAAYLASMIVSFSRTPGLSFPVLPIVPLVPAAPSWVVIACPFLGLPFAKAFMIAEMMIIDFGSIVFSFQRLATVVAGYSKSCTLPRRGVFFNDIIGLPFTHALPIAKISLIKQRLLALKTFAAIIAGYFNGWFPVKRNNLARSRTSEDATARKSVLFHAEHIVTYRAFDCFHMCIIPESTNYVKSIGSGTTIVAAHNNKRRGLGSEKLPKYMGVILERLATHTNTQPELID